MTTGWKRWICLAWLLLIPFSGNAATPMIAAGFSDSLFLNGDGSVEGAGSVSNYYGTSPDEMLSNARYRTIFTVSQP